ncbi:MAG: exodeoxyribonuclease III [Saprospiraceae bacterium]|nr:exodeoxyribonuclease III [Saprospiraceae bacterium]
MALKIVSWNVNGLRAVMKKDFDASLAAMAPDIICLQETKAQEDQVHEALESINGYHIYANSAERKGYSSTAILSKIKPTQVQNDIGVKVHDREGRVITAEYDEYYLVTAYVPNAGRGLVRHDYRAKWDKSFRRFLVNLKEHKPVILCGDLNVAHQPIDLAHPKPNYNKTAGYTQLEIDGFTRHLEAGFVDTFRHLYPETVRYSWWAYFRNAREKNVGWRIDYFLVSDGLMPRVADTSMHSEIMGSDHCPIWLTLR